MSEQPKAVVALRNDDAQWYTGDVVIGAKALRVVFATSASDLWVASEKYSVAASLTGHETGGSFGAHWHGLAVTGAIVTDVPKVAGAPLARAATPAAFGVVPRRDASLSNLPADGVFGLGLPEGSAVKSNSGARAPLELVGNAFPPSALFSFYLTADAGAHGSFLTLGGFDAARAVKAAGKREAANFENEKLRWLRVQAGSTKWKVGLRRFGPHAHNELSLDYCQSSRVGCSAIFDTATPDIEVPRRFYKSFVRTLVYETGLKCFYDNNRLVCDECTADQFSALEFEFSAGERYLVQPSDYLVDDGHFRCRVLISERHHERDDVFVLGAPFLKTHYTVYDARSADDCRVGLGCLSNRYSDTGGGTCFGGVGSFDGATGTRYCFTNSAGKYGSICFSTAWPYYFFVAAGSFFFALGVGTLAHLVYRAVRSGLREYQMRKTQRVQCAPMPETIDGPAPEEDDEEDMLGIPLLPRRPRQDQV
uniref:Peptidase A1 domain-containing protein n=1 Tax=Phaeomonas parva TaxID=124430 RepID=A0A7S1TNZ5_9STRA